MDPSTSQKEFFPRDIADRVATEQVTPKQDHAEEFAWALERFVAEQYPDPT